VPRRLLLSIAAFFLLPLLIGCTGKPGEIRVYAAISLREPLLKMSNEMEEAVGRDISFNFGASNQLARQILAGRKADLFLSADTVQMDFLEDKALLDPGTRRTFLSNRLVIIVPGNRPDLLGSPSWLMDRSVARISLGDPRSVPVGIYARQWLQSLGLWTELQHRIVPASNARAALAAVESGGVQAGIVYASDAKLSKRVSIAYQMDPGEGPEISYQVAVMTESVNSREARKLIPFLAGIGSRRVFETFGFVASSP
jgi:molybdate transport system substrate-binding protein